MANNTKRFQRTEALLGAQAMKNLASSSVMIVGLGAVGGYVLEALARAGIGKLILVDFDVIEKSGSWFSYDGTRLGQGRESAKKVLEDNPELCAEIEAKIRAAADLPEVAVGGDVEATPLIPVNKPPKKK